eukprot:g34308.t1
MGFPLVPPAVYKKPSGSEKAATAHQHRFILLVKSVFFSNVFLQVFGSVNADFSMAANVVADAWCPNCHLGFQKPEKYAQLVACPGCYFGFVLPKQ